MTNGKPPTPIAPHTGGDAVVDVLEWAGVQVLFGIPSVHNLPIYDALARRGTIRAITVRHEQAAAGAADAYARTTGELGVLITSTGPGAANAMGGLLEAFVSGSPVLHLTGQIETAYLDKGRGFIHEVPAQPDMLGALSKQVMRPRSVEEIAVVVAEAVHLALEHPQGPVSVELPIDLQYATVPEELWHRPEPTAKDAEPRGSVPQSWDQAADKMASALRPIIWAGGGAVRSGASELVGELALRIGAGVLTTPNARGVLREDDQRCLGNLSWDPQVRELVADADLLVGIGTRYQGPNTQNWAMKLPANLVQIDIAPEIPGRNYEPSIAVPGDARVVLTYLLARLSQKAATVETPWLGRVAETKRAAVARLRSTLGAQEALLDATARAIADDTIVVKDSTIPAYTWGNRLLPVHRPRRAIMPNGFAIGLGLAHAMGAAAMSSQPVVCMVGDGGFMLTATELATIAAESLPVVVVLFNDGGYGILRNIQDRQYERRIGVDLGHPDFSGLARSLGVASRTVSSAREYEDALRQAMAARIPMLIEVDMEAIGPMARPYTGTSRPPDGATKT